MTKINFNALFLTLYYQLLAQVHHLIIYFVCFHFYSLLLNGYECIIILNLPAHNYHVCSHLIPIIWTITIIYFLPKSPGVGTSKFKTYKNRSPNFKRQTCQQINTKQLKKQNNFNYCFTYMQIRWF